jgi:hypothetical protein
VCARGRPFLGGHWAAMSALKPAHTAGRYISGSHVTRQQLVTEWHDGRYASKASYWGAVLAIGQRQAAVFMSTAPQ